MSLGKLYTIVYYLISLKGCIKNGTTMKQVHKILGILRIIEVDLEEPLLREMNPVEIVLLLELPPVHDLELRFHVFRQMREVHVLIHLVHAV
jgi:hypothetical protein